jgi:succinate-acetate transporter protein
MCLQRSATVWLAPADTNKTRGVVSPPPLLLEAATAASAILSFGMVSEKKFFLRYPLTQPSKMGEKTQQRLEAFRVAFFLYSLTLWPETKEKKPLLLLVLLFFLLCCNKIAENLGLSSGIWQAPK